MAKGRSDKKQRREQKRRKKASKKQARASSENPLAAAREMSDALSDAAKLRTLVKRKMDQGTWDPERDAVAGLTDPEDVLRWIDVKLKGATLQEVRDMLDAGLFLPDDVIQDVALKTDEPERALELLLKLRDTKTELHDLDALIKKLGGEEAEMTRKFADSEEQVRAALDYSLAKLNRGEPLDESEKRLIALADEHNLLTENFYDTHVNWTLQGNDLLLTGDNLHLAMQVPRNRHILAQQIAAQSSTMTVDEALARVEAAVESMMEKQETVVAQAIDESTPVSSTALTGASDLRKAREAGDKMRQTFNWENMLKQLTIRQRRLEAEEISAKSPAMAVAFGLGDQPREDLSDRDVHEMLKFWPSMRANCPADLRPKIDDVVNKLIEMGDDKPKVGSVLQQTFAEFDKSNRGPTGYQRGWQGPMPTSQDEWSVRNYMECMTYLYEVSRGNMPNNARKAEHKRDGALAWAHMRDARIIHFDPQTHADLNAEADDMLVQRFTGMSAHRYWNEIKMSEELASKHYRGVAFGAKNAPWPEHFPFDTVWIGYGAGVLMEKPELKAYFAGRLWTPPDDIVAGAVVGHLVTATGHVWEFLQLQSESGAVALSYEHTRSVEGGWMRRYDLSPWTIPTLIDIVNQHRTMVVEQVVPSFKKEMKDRRKQLGLKGKQYRGHVPPPFYVVKVKNRTIIERMRDEESPGTGRQVSYRHDVRGHWRCRIKVGDLPLDPKLKEKLVKLDYNVYEHMPPKGEDLERLMERGRRKGPKEWVAIKSTFIEAHQSPNNPDLPYVPATRRVDTGSSTPAGFVESDPKDETQGDVPA